MSNIQSIALSTLKPITIGIIGGGQLGKMLITAAKKLSLNVIILDPSKDCPASSLADEHIIANFNDKDAIIRLAEKCDIITYEIELANVDALKELEEQGYKVVPSSYTLSIIQDKLLQRRFMKDNGLPVPKFIPINSKDDLLYALKELGYPALLKVRYGSYDGRGNFVIKSNNDIDMALKFMSNKDCFLEEYVNFTKELSIIVARNYNNITSFPLVENIHKNNILHLTIAPARVDDNTKKEAISIAEKCIDVLKGVGIFCIELFLTDKLLINEIAPRVHNSGHYSIEACDISQFDMHVRAILNLPLVKPRLLSPAVMINILGEEYHEIYKIEGIEQVLALEGTNIHIYGKRSSNKQRKLGHITVLADNIEEAIRRAEYARSLIKITGV